MTTRKQGKHTGTKIPRRNQSPLIELAHVLGEGGQGEVYAVKGEPTLAVKIYHENRRPEGAEVQRLTAMENIEIKVKGGGRVTLPPLAWPQEVIRPRGKEHQVAGFVMPLIDRRIAVPMSHVLTPATRIKTLAELGVNQAGFRDTQWKIAGNIVAVVEAIHNAGCVIGDVNDENILTNPATGEISIVDCDAFQVTDRTNRTIYRCRVGRPEYTAPELLEYLSRETCNSKTCRKSKDEGRHKPDFSCLDRQPEHDMFGISVILFKMFMNGAHPYGQRNLTGTGGTSTLKDLIQQRRYPYKLDSAGTNVTPTNSSLYKALPLSLRQMFHRTFA